MKFRGAAVTDRVPWQEWKEGWGVCVWHRFLTCQQKTAGSTCMGFCAQKSCSAVCRFRPLGTERLYYGECAGEVATAFKKKKKSSPSV